jgi:hypothetical protein
MQGGVGREEARRKVAKDSVMVDRHNHRNYSILLVAAAETVAASDGGKGIT